VLRSGPGLAFLSVAALLVTAAAAGARGVVASCADGSVLLASRWEDVHCAGAIRMPPGVTARVGSTKHRAAALATLREADRERELEEQIAGAVSAERVSPVSLDLTTAQGDELRQLLARGQAASAAFIERPRAVGQADRMHLAHSPELEARLREEFAAAGEALPGPVLVFGLEPSPGASRPPIPAFAQGGVTFRPYPGDARQLGWIGESFLVSPHLGYVVLPAGFDLSRPLVIFWGDAVAATRPAPGEATPAGWRGGGF